jgi:hypothetical protein
MPDLLTYVLMVIPLAVVAFLIYLYLKKSEGSKAEKKIAYHLLFTCSLRRRWLPRQPTRSRGKSAENGPTTPQAIAFPLVRHPRHTARSPSASRAVSSVRERSLHTREVAGSIPAPPTSLRLLRKLLLGKPAHHYRSEASEGCPRRSPKGEDGSARPAATARKSALPPISNHLRTVAMGHRLGHGMIGNGCHKGVDCKDSSSMCANATIAPSVRNRLGPRTRFRPARRCNSGYKGSDRRKSHHGLRREH